jgi:hypothetical protein
MWVGWWRIVLDPRGTNQVWICFVVRAGFGRGELDLEGDMARPDLLLYELEGCHRGCEVGVTMVVDLGDAES